MSDRAGLFAHAISPLFVPANRPALIEKANAAGADAVIVDLEDALAADEKATGRQALEDYVQEHKDIDICLRINARTDKKDFDADLALVARHASIKTVVVPKVEQLSQLHRVGQLGRPMWVLIESAAGVLVLAEAANTIGVERLCFGGLDFATDIGAESSSAGGQAILNHVRSQLVIHSTAAGLAPPLDSPSPDLRETTRLVDRANHACGMGFGGMLCIHPNQISAVRKAFAPTVEQYEWAKRVIKASRSRSGVFKLNGQMIDAPVVARADAVLQAWTDAQ